MNNPIKRIIIVGGGSAGWLSAGLLGAEHQAITSNTIEVMLIESPDVKPVGVGEGTWPSMRNTLNRIGIDEFDFINACGASFKQGSQFVGWKNGHADDVYYHPFMTPQGYTQTNLHAAWQADHRHSPFADVVGVQSHLCRAERAPKQTTTPAWAGVTNYGYHLDAGKFTQLLQHHCTTKLGVKYVSDHIVAVKSAVNGDIAAITCQNSGDIGGDLFIDCSGSAALLLGKHYDIGLRQQDHILFNDTALAVQVPYPDSNAPIASATIATAQQAGWIWDIGLSGRRGVGHTYSSRHSDSLAAQDALQQYLAASVGKTQAEALSLRKIRFTSGYREKFWHNNCVAVGMSSGFLEPLEASALAMVELSITMISDELPVDRDHMALLAKRYNQRFDYRWARVIEFLKLHYVLSQRRDSDYWNDNQNMAGIPERLQQLLDLWRYQPPGRNDFIQNEEVFPSASYQYVLYGMGFDTQPRPGASRFNDTALGQRCFDDNRQKVAQLSAGLPSNRELLNHIAQYGMSPR